MKYIRIYTPAQYQGIYTKLQFRKFSKIKEDMSYEIVDTESWYKDTKKLINYYGSTI